jgi:hypothetical protein
MGRTIYDVPMVGFDAALLRKRVVEWLVLHGFVILDENADGTKRKYALGESAGNYHLETAALPGSLVAINVNAGGVGNPLVFCLQFTGEAGGTRLHAELFMTGYAETSAFGFQIELEADANPWGIGAVYQDRLRVQQTCQAFASELRAWESPPPPPPPG